MFTTPTPQRMTRVLADQRRGLLTFVAMWMLIELGSISVAIAAPEPSTTLQDEMHELPHVRERRLCRARSQGCHAATFAAMAHRVDPVVGNADPPGRSRRRGPFSQVPAAADAGSRSVGRADRGAARLPRRGRSCRRRAAAHAPGRGRHAEGRATGPETVLRRGATRRRRRRLRPLSHAVEADAARRQPRPGSQRRVHALSRLGARSAVETSVRAGVRRPHASASPRRSRCRFVPFFARSARTSRPIESTIGSTAGVRVSRGPMSDHALFAVAPFVCRRRSGRRGDARALHDDSTSARPSSSFAAACAPTARHPLTAIGLLGVLLGPRGHGRVAGSALEWNRDLSRLMSFELAFCRARCRRAVRVSAPPSGVACFDRPRAAPASGTRRSCGVLLLALVSGLAVAVVYRWAAAWSAITRDALRALAV